jgi:hypothetical protein
MQKIAKRQYLSPSAETITVGVQASGTAHLVTYNLDDDTEEGTLHEGETLDIEVSQDKPRRKLSLMFAFSGSSGQYVVTLSGSLGGSDTDVIDDTFGIPGTATEYRFRLQQ